MQKNNKIFPTPPNLFPIWYVYISRYSISICGRVTMSKNTTQQSLLNNAIREAQIEIDASHIDERHYMYMPRRYLAKRGVKIFLLVLLCVLACHSLLVIITPPLFLLAFNQWRQYCLFCTSINISRKKLNMMLAIWWLICVIINIVFWDQVTQIL